MSTSRTFLAVACFGAIDLLAKGRKKLALGLSCKRPYPGKISITVVHSYSLEIHVRLLPLSHFHFFIYMVAIAVFP